MKTLPIFVGYDRRESLGYHVFCHSVLSRTSLDVSFTPMRGSGARADGSSTAFDHSRWDVPRLCGYRGIAVWAECDMLCRADIKGLIDLFDFHLDVMVAKHDYQTRFPVKFLGQANPDYPRKNWSSLMLINCASSVWQRADDLRARGLVSPGELHRFPPAFKNVSLFKEDRIGALDHGWNWLVGEYPFNPSVSLAHFTIGLPCFREFVECDYADEWRAELEAMGRCS